MLPPSYAMSGGSSLKTTAHSKAPQGGAKEKKTTPTCPTTGALGLKQKAPDVSGTSKHPVVTPLGNTVSRASSSFQTARSSLSYTMVGVRKLEGGYRKTLMHKLAKKLESKPAQSGKESESSGAPLRIKRFRKLPSIKRPVGQYESSDEEDTPSKGPSIASLSAKNDSLRDLLWSLNDRLATKLLKIRDLVDDINNLRFKLDHKLAKVAKATRVVDALDEPF
jgi:hypothetical protein